MLYNTDYVLFDKVNNTLATLTNGKAIIYGNIQEAKEDCGEGEEVTKCTSLPKELQDKLISQLRIQTAQDLFDALVETKERWGTLDVPINVFHSEDRHGITMLDLFTDNQIKNERLHSIDINLVD